MLGKAVVQQSYCMNNSVRFEAAAQVSLLSHGQTRRQKSDVEVRQGLCSLHLYAMQVKEGRDGSDEDADEVTGGEKRGSSDKKRKGDVSDNT